MRPGGPVLRAKARLFDHPLHPIMVTIPLGAFPTSVVFDVLTVWTGSAAWYAAAFVATLVGVGGLVAASVPGLMDYNDVVPREGEVWRRATAHMALGFVVTGFFVLLVTYRWLTLGATGGLVTWGALALNLVGNAGLAVQGYWGGELVSRHGVSVHEDARASGTGDRERRSRGEIRGGGSP